MTSSFVVLLNGVLTPVPDRISLISAPNKVTPALLTAVRNAIVANSRYSQAVEGSAQGPGPGVGGPDSPQLAKGVKKEEWVSPGVYCFSIAGMRRFFETTVRKGRIDKLVSHAFSLHGRWDED